SEFVTFTWDAKDNESGVDYVSATFDGKPYEKGTDVDLAGKVGELKLVITAEDKAGNVQEEEYSIMVKTSAADMLKLVERFDDEDAFVNDTVVRMLNLHLMTLDHFEKKKSNEKLLKHLKGLKTLLDHQKENDLISKEVFQILHDDTNYLIEKYQ